MGRRKSESGGRESNKKKDYEELYAEMLLFLPWTDEAELFCNDGDKCIKLFNKSRNTISRNRKSIFPHSDTLQELTICLETAENYRPSHVGDSLSAATEQENLDDLDTMEPVDTSKLPDEPVESTHSEKRFIKPIEVDSDGKMLDMARSLGHEQMVVFGKLIDHAKRIKVSRNTKIMVALNPPCPQYICVIDAHRLLKSILHVVHLREKNYLRQEKRALRECTRMR